MNKRIIKWNKMILTKAIKLASMRISCKKLHVIKLQNIKPNSPSKME